MLFGPPRRVWNGSAVLRQADDPLGVSVHTSGLRDAHRVRPVCTCPESASGEERKQNQVLPINSFTNLRECHKVGRSVY